MRTLIAVVLLTGCLSLREYEQNEQMRHGACADLCDADARAHGRMTVALYSPGMCTCSCTDESGGIDTWTIDLRVPRAAPAVVAAAEGEHGE